MSTSSPSTALTTPATSNSSISATNTTTTLYSTLSYNTTSDPVTITDSEWPPIQTQTGQPSYCNNWYQANQVDDCSSIVFNNNTWMDAEDFLELNPAVATDLNELQYNCDFLIVSLMDISAPAAMKATFVASATLAGIATDCQEYYITEDGDTCESITGIVSTCTARYQADDGDDCDLIVEKRISVPGTPTTRTVTAPALATPTTPANTVSTCENYWLVGTNYRLVFFNCYYHIRTYNCHVYFSHRCNTLSNSNGDGEWLHPMLEPIMTATTSPWMRELHLMTFYTWNPAVKSYCSGLHSGVFVCIGKTGYATTITSGDPTPATPTPTQTGMATVCLRFYDVNSGDSCYNIASDAGVALTDFYSWNPALVFYLCVYRNIWTDYYNYQWTSCGCIGDKYIVVSGQI
ncbi:hypothetical protein PENARI_c017G08337 [Penicillium arizonense]|uniref:LysM domain-containing protein n=1 Tax=Penicillium arizonense TaxID=1835702 RepID=A0A1F5LAW3_PENAI|nr:hypothetical protein PENARI_c017G08337 [Penicillium arizonense]OGE50354.1 hypothetical protein PENARI_c017G08337 [Penicillium arizonense]